MKKLAALAVAFTLLAVASTADAANVGRILIHGHVSANAIQADPIKGFGQSPFGHYHSYCGAGNFSAGLTLPQLTNASSTSFNLQADHSGLWFPTPMHINADGTFTPIAADHMACKYYLSNGGENITSDPPNGVKFVAGNPTGTGPYQSIAYYGSNCSWFATTMPSATASQGCTGFEESLMFNKQCWSGQHYGLGMGSADTAADFLNESPCVDGVAIPQIRFLLQVTDPGPYCLSSDIDLGTCGTSPGASGHFDYAFGWTRDPANGQSAIGELINGCLDVPSPTNPNTYGANDASCVEAQIGTTGKYFAEIQSPKNSTGGYTYGPAIEGMNTSGTPTGG